MRRKYGDYEKMNAYLAEAENRLYKLENSAELYEKLCAEKTALLDELYDRCTALSEARRAGAETFAALIREELSELGMENAAFEVRFGRAARSRGGGKVCYRPTASIQAEFNLSPNVGRRSNRS